MKLKGIFSTALCLLLGLGVNIYRSPMCGHNFEAWQDGKVAHKFGDDYQKKSYTADGTVDIHLAPGGGWAAIISKAGVRE